MFHRWLMGVIVFLGLFMSAAFAGGENLLANGRFEQAKNGKPSLWRTIGNPKYIDQRLVRIRERGESYARLSCTRYESGANHAMLAQFGTDAESLRLEKGKYYRLTCVMRVARMEFGVVKIQLRDITDWGYGGLNKQFFVDTEWNTFSTVFMCSKEIGAQNRFAIQFNETGILYVKWVRLEEMPAPDITFTHVVAILPGANLVPNGSFEAGAGDWTTPGAGFSCSKLQSLRGCIIQAHDAPYGESYLRISTGGNLTPVLGFDAREMVIRTERNLLAKQQRLIKVEPGEKYIFSVSMRSHVEGIPARLEVTEMRPGRGGERDQKHSHRKDYSLSEDWTRYAYEFRPKFPWVSLSAGLALVKDYDDLVEIDLDGVQLAREKESRVFAPRTAVEIELSPVVPAGICIAGSDETAVDIFAANQGDDDKHLTLQFSAIDYFNAEHELPAVNLEIPSGARLRKRLKLPENWRGFYRLKGRWDVEGQAFERTLRLAIVPERRTDNSILGVNHGFAGDDLYPLARKAGVTWYRMWIRWQEIEPEQGRLEWEELDTFVDRYERHGAHILAILPEFPSCNWNSERNVELPLKSGYWGKHRLQIQPPKNPELLEKFVERVVDRYRGRIDAWEFLNEPVYGKRRALPSSQYTVEDYNRLLLYMIAGARRADPEAYILSGISASTYHLSLIKDVIRGGCMEQANALNMHEYPGECPPEVFVPALQQVRATMDRHSGQGKSIWFTEFTYTGGDFLRRAPFFPSNVEPEVRRLSGNSEQRAADYTLRFIACGLLERTEKFFIHAGITSDPFGIPYGCALFEYGGAPMKLFPALAVLTDHLGAKPVATGGRMLAEKVYAVAVETGERSLLIVWSGQTSGGTRYAARIPDGAECQTAMGMLVPSLNVPLSGTPVYLLGDSGASGDLLRSLSLYSVADGLK